jgi:hypothetical protein
VLEDVETDMQVDRTRDKKTETATGVGEETDRKEEHETKSVENVDVLTDRDTDFEDEKHNRNPKDLSVTKMQDSDTRQKRKEWDLDQSAVDDVSLDHKEKAAAKQAAETCKECKMANDKCKCPPAKDAEKVDLKKHAARLEHIYRKRLEAKVAELDKQKKEFEQNLMDRMVRAMKIVASRQALNLEYSPLKTAIGIALCNPRSLGDGYEYKPMDQRTAVVLTEAAFGEPLIEDTNTPAWESFIDGLIHRAQSIMEMSDESLMQVDSDLKNMKTAVVTTTDDVSMPNADIGLRQAANHGNLQLASVGTEEVMPTLPNNKRSAIRSAVGTTKVANLANVGR